MIVHYRGKKKANYYVKFLCQHLVWKNRVRRTSKPFTLVLHFTLIGADSILSVSQPCYYNTESFSEMFGLLAAWMRSYSKQKFTAGANIAC